MQKQIYRFPLPKIEPRIRFLNFDLLSVEETRKLLLFPRWRLLANFGACPTKRLDFLSTSLARRRNDRNEYR